MEREKVLKGEVLDAELRRVTEELRESENRLVAEQTLREELRLRRKILTDLRDKTVAIEVGPRTISEQLAGVTDDRPAPTGAVIDLVNLRPGMTPGEIVHALDGKVASDAEDLRKMLYTIISRLKRDGRLEDREGRVYPKGYSGVSNGTGNPLTDLRLALQGATRVAGREV